MADKYIGFTFNGVRIAMENYAAISEIPDFTYEGLIVNNDNLSLPTLPQFNNEFATPKLGDNSIYTGTTVTSKTFSIELGLKEISLGDFRQALKLFCPEAEGYLIFDYNYLYGYFVKLSKVGAASYVVVSEDVYNITIKLEFITTKDWAAIELDLSSPASPTLYEYTSDTGGPDTFDSFVFQWDDSGVYEEITLTNNSQLEQYLIFEFDATTKLVENKYYYDGLVNYNGDPTNSIVSTGIGNDVEVGDTVVVSGSAQAGNNGTFSVLSITNASTIIVNGPLTTSLTDDSIVEVYKTVLDVTLTGTDLIKFYSRYGVAINTVTGEFVSATLAIPSPILSGEIKDYDVKVGTIDKVSIVAREIL